MIKVGITGNMGSGKSTACRLFQQLGIPVYDADARAKWLMTNNEELKQEIVKLFGISAYLADGSLSTEHIGAAAFKNPTLLNSLNQLVHPVVAEDAKNWHQAQNAPFTLREAALLIESGSYKQLDKLIVITAPETLRVERVKARNNWSEEHIKDRMSKQMDENTKVSYADYVIINDGNKSLIEQVLAIYKDLIKLEAAS